MTMNRLEYWRNNHISKLSKLCVFYRFLQMLVMPSWSTVISAEVTSRSLVTLVIVQTNMSHDKRTFANTSSEFAAWFTQSTPSSPTKRCPLSNHLVLLLLGLGALQAETYINILRGSPICMESSRASCSKQVLHMHLFIDRRTRWD